MATAVKDDLSLSVEVADEERSDSEATHKRTMVVECFTKRARLSSRGLKSAAPSEKSVPAYRGADSSGVEVPQNTRVELVATERGDAWPEATRVAVLELSRCLVTVPQLRQVQ